MFTKKKGNLAGIVRKESFKNTHTHVILLFYFLKQCHMRVSPIKIMDYKSFKDFTSWLLVQNVVQRDFMSFMCVYFNFSCNL